MEGGDFLAQEKNIFLKCIVCGKEYRGCRTCQDRIEYNPWRAVCDTPLHYQVYSVIQQIQGGVITNTEAIEILSHLNVSESMIEDFLPNVKSFLEPLFIEKTSKKSKNTIKKERVEEISIVDKIETEVAEEQ